MFRSDITILAAATTSRWLDWRWMISRKHFRDATNVGGNYEEASASSFHDGYAKRLGQGAVEKDVSLRKNVPYLWHRHRKD